MKNLLTFEEFLNESKHFEELKKLEDVIKTFQDKIKSQGRVTNARDEEHLERLIKLYKEMGGKKNVNESVEVGDKKIFNGKVVKITRIVDDRIYIKDGQRPEVWVKSNDLEDINESKNDEYIGHIKKTGKDIYVDSNFINRTHNILPNSELKHLGFGEFYIQTPNGDIQFARTGDSIKGFVGRVHKMYDDKSGKLVDELLKGMLKSKKAVEI